MSLEAETWYSRQTGRVSEVSAGTGWVHKMTDSGPLRS